jgi:recombinational DNA repair ATPase RecF
MPSDVTASPYDDLRAALDEQLARTARFVPAAFHVHSIQSYDWGKDGDSQRNDQAQFMGPEGQARFLDEIVAAGLEVVCITDHMQAAYACELAQQAAARDDITVFPGMEISCSVPPAHREYIHVLVVFPADTTADVIERLFADSNLPGAANRSGHEHVRFASLAEVRERVANAHGLFVLAHIDQDPRGHRRYVRSVRGETAEMFGLDATGAETIAEISTEYAEHLAALHPHAVEVMKSSDRPHYWGFHTTDGTKQSFPCLARSDHHTVEHLADADAVTHIKVSRRDLHCVGRALTFHDTRVRFADDLPALPSPRLIGLRLRGSGGGLFSEATIAFNQNLNCLIGPRGSGKSTIIEALRYALGQRSLLEDAGLSEGESGSYAGLALATQDANLRDCEIEVIYENDGEQRVLAATYDSEETAPTRVFTLDGTDCRVGSEALTSTFPARIFSWSELETLGRQPRLQRLVVDRLAHTLPALQQRRDELRDALEANRRSVGELRAELERLLAVDHGALRRYTEHKVAYERLNTPEVASLFADLDRVRARIAMLDSADEQLSELALAIGIMREHTPATTIAGMVADGSEDVREWWSTDVAPALELDLLATLLDTQTNAILAEVSKRREVVETARTAQQEAADAADEALREQTHADPGTSVRREQREHARRQYERATDLRSDYLKTLDELEAALATRTELLDELVTVRDEISNARERTAEKLAARLGDLIQTEQRISIEVTPGGDRVALQTHLDAFLNPERGGHYRSKALPERLAQMTPTELAEAILEHRPQNLVGAGTDISQEEAERLIGAFDVYPTDQGADVKRVSAELDELLLLQEQPVDDLVSIRSDDQPVHELSPGGRSSAMLPLIALSDNVPLIIDQPEDNLDNRMVGQTLSSILSRLKEHRQIIVTTHNPNIVVGGDAEQVVVLDAPSARSAKVALTGSIDDDEIIDAVIKIMEGGREAFEERHRRYRDRLEG